MEEYFSGFRRTAPSEAPVSAKEGANINLFLIHYKQKRTFLLAKYGPVYIVTIGKQHKSDQ